MSDRALVAIPLGALLIGGGGLALVLELSSRAHQRENHALEGACRAPAILKGDVFADPLTLECGGIYGRVPRGTREACSRVLAMPEFAHMRHCWQKDGRQ